MVVEAMVRRIALVGWVPPYGLEDSQIRVCASSIDITEIPIAIGGSFSSSTREEVAEVTVAEGRTRAVKGKVECGATCRHRR
jgi:hypothetical protein